MNLILSQIIAPAVPQSGELLMPAGDSLSDGLLSMVLNALEYLHPDLAEAAGISLSLIAVIVLVSLAGMIPGAKLKTAEFVGTVGIGTILLNSTNSLIHLGTSTIEDMSGYGKLLLPVMTSAMAAQGGVTTSTALYAGTAFFDVLLTSVLTGLLNPMIYIFLVLCTANAALGEDVLKKMASFLKWLAVWILKTVLYIFTGYMGITGVISGTTDAATLKAAKLTISGVVPVVGGILADASEAVLVSADLVRNTAGIYGILAILAVFLLPFLKIGCHYLILRLTGAVCGIFGIKRCTDLISDFSAAMGLLLAMTGSVCLLQLISTVCFLRGVG